MNKTIQKGAHVNWYIRQRVGAVRLISCCLVFLFIALVLSGCNPQATGNPGWKNLTTSQKLEDFRYLFRVLKENHGKLALIKRLYGYDWLAHEKEFEEEIRRTRDDLEFALAIDRILDSLNDPHTAIMPPRLWTAYLGLHPFDDVVNQAPEAAVTYWYELASQRPYDYEVFPALYFEGEYVVVTELDVGGQVVRPGWTVTGVNGVDVDRFILDQGVDLRYDPVHHKPYAIGVILPREEKVRLTFKDSEGNCIEAEVVPSQEEWPGKYYRPSYYSNEDGTLVHDSLFMTVIPGVAGYMHFWDMPSFTLEDWALVREFLESVKDLPALIIDVRDNRGGFTSDWENLVKLITPQPMQYDRYFAPRNGDYVKKILPQYFQQEKPDYERDFPEWAAVLPPEVLTDDFACVMKESITGIGPDDGSIKYSGKIFVLTDSGTHSAADSFACFCKRTKWATVIGTFTRGDGGGANYGLVPLVLPNGRMVIYFPFDLALEPDGRSHDEFGTMPDIYVADRQTFVKYVNALIKGEELKSLDPDYDAVLRECLRIIKSSGQSD